MALENSTFGWGGAVFPLTSSTANSLLQDADPAVYWALQFYSSVLNTHLGARFTAETTPLSLPSSAVAMTLPYDPTPYLRQVSVPFPLLAVFRVDERIDDHTQSWQHSTSTWQVLYALPPLSAEARERVGPILNAAANVLTRATWLGFDPGFLSGAVVWSPQYAYLEEIYVTQRKHGNLPGSTPDVWFPSVVLTLQCKERQNPIAGAFDALGGTDDNIKLADNTGTDTGLLPIKVAT